MVEKLRGLINKHWEKLSYLFFGGLTTVVNWLFYFPLYHYAHFNSTASNVIAWVVAVIFAYVTNKPFVFQSHDWSLKVVAPEFGKFVSARLLSGGFETVFLAVFVDWLQFNGIVMKILVSVVVVILNYVASKLLVFRKAKS